MSDVYMLLGFTFAAYSIIANDSIQTLGTFLSSNSKRPWWALWLWIAGILVLTVLWGWYCNDHDPAFGRLDKKGIEFPLATNWLYVVPPLVLVALTRSGIPVSTSFLVLTSFSALTALQHGNSQDLSTEIFANMLKKSVVGYVLAAAVGLLAYGFLVTQLERHFQNDEAGHDHPPPYWFAFQWLSTGFLWSMWLVQDLANVFVYLPRRIPLIAILIALTGMVTLLAILMRERGGKIQKVVIEKTNTVDLRSATLIDLFYGLILLFFKVDYIPSIFHSMGWEIPWPSKMPMSTTWVFLGLLAGREAGMWLRMRQYQSTVLGSLVSRDLLKVVVGTVVSLAVAFVLPAVGTMAGLTPPPSTQPNQPTQALQAPEGQIVIPHATDSRLVYKPVDADR